MKRLYIFMFIVFTAIIYSLIGKCIDERRKFVRTHENSLKTHLEQPKETVPINEIQKNHYERIYNMP